MLFTNEKPLSLHCITPWLLEWNNFILKSIVFAVGDVAESNDVPSADRCTRNWYLKDILHLNHYKWIHIGNVYSGNQKLADKTLGLTFLSYFFQNHFFSYDFITLLLCVFYHVFIVQTNYTRISDCTGNFIVTEQAEKKTKKVFISAIDYTCFIPLMLFCMDVFTAVFYNFWEHKQF